MLVSFFKTPRYKRFNYKPLYIKEDLRAAASTGADGILNTKRIRFKRNSMVQPGSTRHLGGLRFVGLFAAILGLSGVMVGDAEWRQASYALLLFAGWVGWRLFGSPKPVLNKQALNKGRNDGN